MRTLAILAVGVAICLIAYGFGVVDTLNDIRIKCPDLYEALKERVKEEDHETD